MSKSGRHVLGLPLEEDSLGCALRKLRHSSGFLLRVSLFVRKQEWSAQAADREKPLIAWGRKGCGLDFLAGGGGHGYRMYLLMYSFEKLMMFSGRTLEPV